MYGALMASHAALADGFSAGRCRLAARQAFSAAAFKIPKQDERN